MQLGKADAGVKIERTKTEQHDKSIGERLPGRGYKSTHSPQCTSVFFLFGEPGAPPTLTHMLDTWDRALKQTLQAGAHLISFSHTV